MNPSGDTPRMGNFRTLVERSADAILVLDREGIIRLANPAAEAIFRRGRLLGERFGYPISSGSKTEIEILAADGESVATAEMHLVGIDWEGAPAFLATLRDVTDHKRSEAALDAARNEQIELRHQILSQVSHELRTPLAAIQEFVALVRDGVAGPVSGEQAQYLDGAARNVKQLGSLIDDLVEVARAQSGKLRVQREPVDLRKLVCEGVREIAWAADAAGVSLEADFAPRLPRALGDATRTRQVLANLLGNAIKFTPEEGSVSVAVAPDPHGPGFLRVSVADTGCGIREESRESIFERMHQAPATRWKSRKGLGLGLTICRDLIQLQGGRIWLESQVEKGSCFHFTLPDFSLERLLAPALLRDGRLRETFGVLRVDLVPPERSRAVPDSLRRRTRDLMQASIYPEVDVLLPQFGTSRDRLWAVLGTDAVGAESLAERLRSRLCQIRDVERLGLRVYVKAWCERTGARARPSAAAEAVPVLADRISRLVGLDARAD